MNYIDEALSKSNSGEEFVQALGDIYEHADVRGQLSNYPKWIRNIITVIDYDTELAMNGLEFKSYRDVIDALRDIGIFEEADTLAMLEGDSSQENGDLCYSKLSINNNYEKFWDKVFQYADEKMKCQEL